MKILFRTVCITMVFLSVFSFSSCSSPNTLTVAFAEGVELVLEEREFPKSPWDERREIIEIQGKKYIRSGDFYVYTDLDLGGEDLLITKTRRYADVIHTPDYGLILGANIGHYGGGIYYFKKHIDFEAVMESWEYETVIEQGSFLINFWHDCPDHYSKNCLVFSVPCEPAYEYMFTTSSVYRFWCASDDHNLRYEVVFERTLDDDHGGVRYGLVHDNTVYLVLTDGLFRLENGELVQLSKQSIGFWESSYSTSATVCNGKIYVAGRFGIYEYDLATGEETLYTCEQTPALLTPLLKQDY